MSRLYYDRPATRAWLASGVDSRKEYLEKVARLIPGEIVAGYLTLIGFVPLLRQEWPHWAFYLGIFLLCLILTPFYLNYLADENKPKVTHLIVSTLAFIFWAYAVSGTVLCPNIYDPALASILLICFSLVSGIIPLG